MGFAIAAEAISRGADVTLIVGPGTDAPPPGPDVVRVTTANEMRDAVLAATPLSDAIVMAAAVADFRPTEAADGKIKKGGRDELTIRLEPTTDVLGAVALDRRPGQTLVGFAAEHGDGLESARAKLDRKRLDAVVLNDVSQPGIGFDSLENEVTVLTAAGEHPVPRASKRAVASAILDCVESLRKTQSEVTQ